MSAGPRSIETSWPPPLLAEAMYLSWAQGYSSGSGSVGPSIEEQGYDANRIFDSLRPFCEAQPHASFGAAVEAIESEHGLPAKAGQP